MIVQTNRLLYGSGPSWRLAGFVFFSTICSYNFHWFLTPRSASPSRRVQWTQRHKALHFVLYLAGIAGALVYFFSLWEHWMALCFGIFVTFLYSAPKLPQPVFRKLKTIAVGKTFFLAFVWMYVTTMLPIIIAGGRWDGPAVLFSVSRFFLIYAICIVFDYRDRQADKAEGIRSLITWLSEKGITLVFIISLLLYAAGSIGLYAYQYSIFTIILLLAPGILLALLYDHSRRSDSDYFYYVVLDGLMMFSGLLMLLFGI